MSRLCCIDSKSVSVVNRKKLDCLFPVPLQIYVDAEKTIQLSSFIDINFKLSNLLFELNALFLKVIFQVTWMYLDIFVLI